MVTFVLINWHFDRTPIIPDFTLAVGMTNFVPRLFLFNIFQINKMTRLKIILSWFLVFIIYHVAVNSRTQTHVTFAIERSSICYK